MRVYIDMTAVEVIEEFKNLPIKEQSQVIDYLENFKEQESNESNKIHVEWKETIDRRSQELHEGTVETITSEEVKAYARKKLDDTRKVSS